MSKRAVLTAWVVVGLRTVEILVVPCPAKLQLQVRMKAYLVGLAELDCS